MPSFAAAPTCDSTILRLAEGGMGYIELVARRDGRFSRFFARKRLHPQLRGDPTFRSMFLDEARLSGLIQHPNVTAVIEVGEDEDGPFLLMDYVDGVTVAQVLERVEPLDRPLPLALCVSIVAQAARGLHAAHQLVAADGAPLRVVHRDISPKNLLLGFDGWLRVADFGIAKASDNVEQTRVGVLKGNIGYMAPEYLSFQAVDQRSDLFALGVVLYELLTRERLYAGGDPVAVARRILDEPPPDIFELRDVPPELSELSFDLLAKDCEQRPPSALAVAARLDEISANLAAVDGPFDVAAFLEHELRALREERKRRIDAALARSEPAAARATAGLVSAAVRRLGSRRTAWLAVAAVPAALLLAFGAWRLARARRSVAFAPGSAALWAGGRHNCALRAQRLLCWGNNDRGQLGDETLQDRDRPTPVASGAFNRVALGEWGSCALGSDGVVACWGRNTRGEAGRPEPRRIERPMPVLGLGPATALAAGRQHFCALLASGKVNCWGANDSGQLGRPPSAEIEPPGEVRELAPARQLFAGGANSCARLLSGELVCWGANESGQLRDGTLQNRATPTRLTGGEDFSSLAIGNNSHAGSPNPDRSKIASFMCAVTRAGSVYCWGNNYTGQLGDGTRENRAAPTAVAGVSDAIEVAAGDVHACALLRSGAVSCWGRNEFGAVGDDTMGPSTVRPTPLTVIGLQDAVGLALGGAHSCARRRNGTVVCWGINNTGQLGDGSTILRTTPVAVEGFP